MFACKEGEVSRNSVEQHYSGGTKMSKIDHQTRLSQSDLCWSSGVKRDRVSGNSSGYRNPLGIAFFTLSTFLSLCSCESSRNVLAVGELGQA